jgi:hypothetical protein
MAEVPDDLSGYLPAGVDVTWLAPPAPGQSALAEVVEGIEWPEGEGYFWMAGESAQMRAIRKHLMRELKLPSTAYDVMGYWRGGAKRQPRAVDPGPIYRAGKAAGKTEEQIWADYDASASDGRERDVWRAQGACIARRRSAGLAGSFQANANAARCVSCVREAHTIFRPRH